MADRPNETGTGHVRTANAFHTNVNVYTPPPPLRTAPVEQYSTTALYNLRGIADEIILTTSAVSSTNLGTYPHHWESPQCNT